MLTLTVPERVALKAQAHALNPIILIGAAGLTESVLSEINLALSKHELIKVRVMAERAEREAILTEVCQKLEAGAVQHIGKTLIIYRPNPEGSAATKKHKQKKKPARLTKKQMASK